MSAVFGTVHEAARALGCDANHVYYLINIGTLDAFKVRWIYRINMATVEDYAQARNRSGDQGFAGHPGRAGSVFVPASLFRDRAEGIAPRGGNPGLHRGWGMVHRAGGSRGLSRAKRDALTPPVQLEFAIA